MEKFPFDIVVGGYYQHEDKYIYRLIRNGYKGYILVDISSPCSDSYSNKTAYKPEDSFHGNFNLFKKVEVEVTAKK